MNNALFQNINMNQLISVFVHRGQSTEACLRHTAVIVPLLMSNQINIGAEIEELVEKSILLPGRQSLADTLEGWRLRTDLHHCSIMSS